MMKQKKLSPVQRRFSPLWPLSAKRVFFSFLWQQIFTALEEKLKPLQPTNQPRFLPKPVLFLSFFSHDEMEPQRCLAGLHRMGATHAIPQLRVLAAN
jgi:hypothetical protein